MLCAENEFRSSNRRNWQSAERPDNDTGQNLWKRPGFKKSWNWQIFIGTFETHTDQSQIFRTFCKLYNRTKCTMQWQTDIHILDIPPAISEKMQLIFFSKNLKFVRKYEIFQKSEFFPKSNFSPQNPIFLLPKIKIIHNSCKSHNMSERNHVPRQPC